MFIPVVHAKNNEVHQGTVDLLYAIGVADKKNFSEAELQKEVSRKEFAAYTVKLMNANTNSIKEIYFNDITDEDCNKNVSYLVQHGCITVGEDRNFYPDRVITKDEAMKILVCVLGYADFANSMGGYPQGYNALARDAGISVSKYSSKITKADLLNMLLETLDASPSTITDIKDGHAVISKGNDNTLLYNMFKISKSRGIVKDYEVDTDEIRILIGDKKLSMYEGEELSTLDKLPGSEVYVYYTEEEEIVSIYETGRTEKKEISISDFLEFDSGYQLLYQSGKSTKKVRMNRNIELYYNGVKETKNQIDIINSISSQDNGYIIAVKSGISDGYDYCIIKHYKDAYVTFIDEDNEILYNKITENKIELNDYDSVRLYNSEKHRVDMGSISEKSVLSVAESKDHKIFEAIICSDSFKGTLEGYRQDDDEDSITINGELHSVGNGFFDNNNILTKKTVKAYVNFFGQVVILEYDDENKEGLFAFLIKSYYDEDEEGYYLKYYGEDEKFDQVLVSDKVKVDGVRAKSYQNFLDLMPESNANTIKPQLVILSFDKEGKISGIDTTKSTSKEEYDGLTATKITGKQFNYAGGGKTVGWNGYITNNSVIFYVPEINSIINGTYNVDEFLIKKTSDLLLYSYASGNLTGYKKCKDSIAEDVLVIENTGESTTYQKNQSLLIFEKQITTLNNDDMPQTQIMGYINGKQVRYYIDEKYEAAFNALNIEEGDALAYGFNSRDEINELKMVYDASQGGTPYSQQGTNWKSETAFESTNGSLGAQWSCGFGFVGMRNNYIAKCFVSQSADFYTTCDLNVRIGDSITFIDPGASKGNKIYIGSTEDIRDAKSVGKYNCDILIALFEYNTLKNIIIYRAK